MTFFFLPLRMSGANRLNRWTDPTMLDLQPAKISCSRASGFSPLRYTIPLESHLEIFRSMGLMKS